MKVKLIFDLDKDDEHQTVKAELDAAMNGAKYKGWLEGVQEDLHQIFRNANKYDTVPFIEGTLSDVQYDIIDKFGEYYYKNIYKEVD